MVPARSERLSQVYPLTSLEASVFIYKVRWYMHLAVCSESCLTTEVERVTRALGRLLDATTGPGAYVYRSCDGFLVRLAGDCGYPPHEDVGQVRKCAVVDA